MRSRVLSLWASASGAGGFGHLTLKCGDLWIHLAELCSDASSYIMSDNRLCFDGLDCAREFTTNPNLNGTNLIDPETTLDLLHSRTKTPRHLKTHTGNVGRQPSPKLHALHDP